MNGTENPPQIGVDPTQPIAVTPEQYDQLLLEWLRSSDNSWDAGVKKGGPPDDNDKLWALTQSGGLARFQKQYFIRSDDMSC